MDYPRILMKWCMFYTQLCLFSQKIDQERAYRITNIMNIIPISSFEGQWMNSHCPIPTPSAFLTICGSQDEYPLIFQFQLLQFFWLLITYFSIPCLSRLLFPQLIFLLVHSILRNKEKKPQTSTCLRFVSSENILWRKHSTASGLSWGDLRKHAEGTRMTKEKEDNEEWESDQVMQSG